MRAPSGDCRNVTNSRAWRRVRPRPVSATPEARGYAATWRFAGAELLLAYAHHHYSGMVPGFLQGTYAEGGLAFDLAALCCAAPVPPRRPATHRQGLRAYTGLLVLAYSVEQRSVIRWPKRNSRPR